MDKKYLSSVCLYIVTGIVAIFLISFVIYHLVGGDTSYPSSVALRTQAEQSISGDGYLFKSETILRAGVSGSVYSPFSEGENVGAGTEVAFVYSDADLVNALTNCDNAISFLKNSMKTGERELSMINARLKELTAGMRALSAQGNGAGLSEMQEALQLQLNRRKTATGAVAGINKEIERLTAERASLRARLPAPLKTLSAPVSGNYFPRCDGYEQLFSADVIPDLTVSSFLSLTESQPETLPQGEISLGKIAQSSYWYFSIVTDDPAAVHMTVGKSYTVYAGAGEEKLTMTLEKVSVDPEMGLTLLVLGSRINPVATLSRCEQIRIVVQTYSGLMVPTGAVRYLKTEEDGDQVGVYTKEGSKVIFKKIQILAEHKGYYVVKEFSADKEEYRTHLKLNDVIITSGKGIKEGYVE